MRMSSADAVAVLKHTAARVTQEELERTVRSHEAFLSHTRNGRRAVLQSRHLAGVDLSNRTLCEADLTGSNLCGANLKFVNLTGAILYCCGMERIDARYGNFTRADMRGVVLNESNLAHARLDRVDFRAARLLQGGSWEADNVVHRGGSAAGVDFSYCSLTGATFQGADLEGADFTGAIVQGTKFAGARMTHVTFKDAIFIDVDLDEIPVPRSALEDCVLPPSQEAIAAVPQILFRLNAHQRWINSDARIGSCAVLDDEDLRPLANSIGKFKLTAISARRIIAAGVDFSCTELQGANFEGADLRGASFEGADLRGARLGGARLHHAKFLGADMRPLELKSGSRIACDLTGAGLSDEQKAEAIFA